MTRIAEYGTAEWRRWKHDHHWQATGAVVDPLGAGNSALRTALGGNSAVLAFYDVRMNVATSGATVTAWDDVRGSVGFGPTLVGTAHAPAWDSTNLLITPNGTSTYLLSAAVSLLNPSLAQSVVYVGTIPTGATGTFCVSMGNGTALNGPTVGSLGASNIFGKAAGTNVSTTVAAGTTRRLVLVSQNGGTVGASECPTTAQQTVVVTNPGSNSNAIAVGVSAQNSSSFSSPVVRAILVLAGAYTTAQRDALKTWATTFHAAVLT